MTTIGRLGKKTGTKLRTVRSREPTGLPPEPGRPAGGRRRYGAADLDRLALIRHTRQLGFSLDTIRGFPGLADRPDRSCADADCVRRRQFEPVEDRVIELRATMRRVEREHGAPLAAIRGDRAESRGMGRGA